MLICHQNKFIFIKTRKTAGTSVELALSQFCGPNDIIMKLGDKDEAVRKELGYQGPRNYMAPFSTYKLTDWKELLRRGKRKSIGKQHSPASFIKALAGDEVWREYFKFCFERNPFERAISRYFWKKHRNPNIPDINEYIQANNQSQLSNWNKYTIDDRIAVDFIGRYENLENDILEIAKLAGIPPFPLPHTKNIRTNRTHYSQLLNRTTRVYIEKMCAKEIEAFGYYWTDQ